MKAGLAGYAQVYGKYNTTPYDKLKLDLFYIENYSVWLDLKLMLLTLKILFTPDSTEGVDEKQVTAMKKQVQEEEKIMPLKRDEAFWKEGMDEKRFALCCIHKIWICLAAALAGAVFAAGIYLGARQLTMGPKQYRSEVLYSIVYDIDEDDEVLKRIYQRI